MTAQPTSVPIVFLGGTCGGDLWRTPFETALTTMGVSFFNPQVDDWQPWMAEEENRCIAHSPVVLMPVLASTLGLGTLGEVGFSILAVLRSILAGHNRTLITLIDPEADAACTIKEQIDGAWVTVQASPGIIRESNRMRALVRSKVATFHHPNVILVDTLEMMQTTLHQVLEQQEWKQVSNG